MAWAERARRGDVDRLGYILFDSYDAWGIFEYLVIFCCVIEMLVPPFVTMFVTNPPVAVDMSMFKFILSLLV